MLGHSCFPDSTGKVNNATLCLREKTLRYHLRREHPYVVRSPEEFPPAQLAPSATCESDVQLFLQFLMSTLSPA